MPYIPKVHFMKVAGEVMADTEPLTVHITIAQAWTLIAALQLAWRHPHIEAQLKARIRDLTREFQTAIIERHPQADDLIQMGWDKRHDR